MMGKYIVYRRALFLYYILSAGLTAAFWLLNKMQHADVLYSLLLLTTVFLLIVVFDYASMRRRHKELQEIIENLSAFEQKLPEGANLIERDYRAVAEGFQARVRQETQALERAHHATIDYYTLWMHQIKTPIAAMRLLLSSPELNSSLMQQELFHIERYVELALQYVKTADLAADLVLAPCEIEPVVRECLKKFAPLFIAKKLSAEIAPLHLTFTTDAKWFAFLFEQLLSNAVKYTKTGGVKIYASGNALVLEDTGTGIRVEDLSRVFEWGYTGRNGRLDKRATGIGLYLARRVADALGMRLELSPAPGHGTRALIQFPCCPPPVFE